MIRRTRYYLVSYAHPAGFGNIFFKSRPHLDVRAAEKTIVETNNFTGVVIISINRVNKKQYVSGQ